MTLSRWCPKRAGNLILAASLVVAAAACDDDNGSSKAKLTNFGAMVPTPLFTTAIAPLRLGITPFFGANCVTFPSFSTRFDLVISALSGDLRMDRVSIQMLDGTNLGGTPLLISAADLTARFGSTRVRAGTRRNFAFDPQFGCSPFVPFSLAADVLLVDEMGSQHTTRAIAPIDR